MSTMWEPTPWQLAVKADEAARIKRDRAAYALACGTVDDEVWTPDGMVPPDRAVLAANFRAARAAWIETDRALEALSKSTWTCIHIECGVAHEYADWDSAVAAMTEHARTAPHPDVHEAQGLWPTMFRLDHPSGQHSVWYAPMEYRVQACGSCEVSLELRSQWRNGPHWHVVWPEGSTWCYETEEGARERLVELYDLRRERLEASR